MPEGLIQRMEQQPPSNGDQEITTPEEDEAHQAAMQMVAEMLYENDESNAAIMDMLQSDNPSQSAADATVFLLSKVEETFQGNYPEALVLPTADEVSDMVLEIADEAGVFKVTEDIAIQTKSIVVQQLIEDYGVDEAAFTEATQGVTEQDLASYEQMLGVANG